MATVPGTGGGGGGFSAGAGLGAAGDLFAGLFGASGNKAEEKAYKKAAAYAGQNAVIAKEAGDIKLEQAGRQIFKTLGAQQAEYAGAGLTGGGSAQSVLRSSISQGALEKAIINEQTQINVTGYLAQQAEFTGMAQAAKAAAAGDLVGGIIGAASKIIPFL